MEPSVLLLIPLLLPLPVRSSAIALPSDRDGDTPSPWSPGSPNLDPILNGLVSRMALPLPASAAACIASGRKGCGDASFSRSCRSVRRYRRLPASSSRHHSKRAMAVPRRGGPAACGFSRPSSRATQKRGLSGVSRVPVTCLGLGMKQKRPLSAGMTRGSLITDRGFYVASVLSKVALPFSASGLEGEGPSPCV